MKILILEDNLERIEKFKILFKNQEVCFCKTVEEAQLACIENILTPFQAMWLDHDLNGKIWEDSFKEESGYQFVKWLVDGGFQKHSLNYIHSMNPVGANLMLNYLLDNGYDGIWIPFHILKLEEK
jgi:hypothetical protein